MKKTSFQIGVIFLVFFLSLFTIADLLGQTEPVIGLHQNTPNVIALINARIITSQGKTLENATLVIRNEQIVAVGTKTAIPADATVRDLKGKTIYPGFIDLFTNYGLSKKSNKRGNSSSNNGDKKSDSPGAKSWNAAVHPEIRAEELLHEDVEMAKSFRSNGFTTVLTFPEEGIFRGNGALVLLNDQKPNQTILASDIAQAMSFSRGKSFIGRGVAGYPGSLMGSIALIRQTFLDAQWYKQAWEKYGRAPAGQKAPETNISLVALQPYAAGQKPVVFDVTDELGLLRANKIAKEFNLKMWVVGSGHEYRRLQDVKSTSLKLIIPLNFPEKPDVDTKEKEINVSLRQLKHWDSAAENPGRLTAAGIEIALTAAFLEKKDEFLAKIRDAVRRGLPPDKALKALTETPAKWMNLSHLLGNLKIGKLANFMITDGDVFDKKTKILSTWVAGKEYEITKLPETEIRGTWQLSINMETKSESGTIKISGKPLELKADIHLNNKKATIKNIALKDHLVMLSFPGDSSGHKGLARMTGIMEGEEISGHGVWGGGMGFQWSAQRTEPWQEVPDTSKIEPVQSAAFPVVYPDGAFGITTSPAQPAALFVKNATIWTCGPAGIIETGSLIIKKGKINAVGKNLKAPSNATVIDATGKHITPGLIDAHAHIALTGGVNEGTHAITSETRCKDIIYSDDISIYRQLAGGLTSACVLHGSANPIGGTYAVIKLRWGSSPDKLVINEAKDGIKFALGENVKQSNWNTPVPRYPQTRMGVMEIIRDAFQTAKDYRRDWEIYRKSSNKNLIAPRKILRYETILDILDGKTIIHCHSYRQDEILAMMRLAEEMGFKVRVFIHILEGYKVAEELKSHGAMATTFSDWWAYKVEAYDAIPYNGAIMHEQGVVVSYNSDSAELARRLNTEASKAVKYGNVPPHEALQFVTLNAAKQLYLDHRIGSLEKGKDADFVIWSDSPISTYSACEQTWVDGRKYFDIDVDKELRKKAAAERNTLVQKILSKKEEKKADKKNKKHKSFKNESSW